MSRKTNQDRKVSTTVIPDNMVESQNNYIG
jgi:hypothetical protein